MSESLFFGIIIFLENLIILIFNKNKWLDIISIIFLLIGALIIISNIPHLTRAKL